jgi:hypothetical protein
LIFFLWTAEGCLSALADDVGEVSANASAIYTGNTYHGYAEIRVDLQNRSHSKAHVVTLIYPDNSYGGYGNNISRLSRTITLAPGSGEKVSLLLPPLPSRGDALIRVDCDDGHQGLIHAPNANDHCNYNGGDTPATIFISRNLDNSAVERIFHASQGAFTPAMAVGPPDAHSYGPQPTTWMPDATAPGETNWLELDYATAQPASKISVYNTISAGLSGSIYLLGLEGTNLVTIPLRSGKSTRTGTGWVMEYDLPATSVPVRTVRLDFGTSLPNSIGIDAVQISGPGGSQWAEDARASSDNSAQAAGWGMPRQPVNALRAESPVAGWSELWLAYSPFDAVVLEAADISSASTGVFDALGNYLQAGGNVVLFGTTVLPAQWHPWEQQHINGGDEYRVGFGRCFVLATENPAALNRNAIQSLRAAVNDMADYWTSLPRDGGAAESALPIHGNTEIPARGIVLIMLSFIIVIGPANLFFLSRYKRRIWMLWTIPAISFASTMMVFVYSLVREGITPDTHIAGLTVLDQSSRHAATFGGESFYCPLTPGGGLHFDYGTEATPLVNLDNYRSSSSREVDWSQSQHFGRGWVSARIPAYFHLRRSETRRERIEVSAQNGNMQIVNGLGAPIKSIWLADKNMSFFQANNIEVGQKSILARSKQTQSLVKSGPDGLKRDLGFGVGGAGDIGDGAQKYLRPGTFIAVLDGNPFIENALVSSPNPKHSKSEAVVFGVLDPAQDP